MTAKNAGRNSAMLPQKLGTNTARTVNRTGIHPTERTTTSQQSFGVNCNSHYALHELAD
jgi:hypothetical protein